ncbi:hypothetical protein VTN96DRAFT_5059 [Rasamsonia emersonii]
MDNRLTTDTSDEAEELSLHDFQSCRLPLFPGQNAPELKGTTEPLSSGMSVAKYMVEIVEERRKIWRLLGEIEQYLDSPL